MKTKLLRKLFLSLFLIAGLTFAFSITDNADSSTRVSSDTTVSTPTPPESPAPSQPPTPPPPMEPPMPLPQQEPQSKPPVAVTPAPPPPTVPAAAAPVLPPPAPTQAPVTPQTTCSLSVRCDTLLDQADRLGTDKASLVPTNGVIFSNAAVPFTSGETVFDVLERELKDARVHLEFSMTPLYHSAYIEGMGNLYEFDCGGLSGWVYRVNDVFPGYGCSSYALKDGDRIEWLYTCDLGSDVGGGKEQLTMDN